MTTRHELHFSTATSGLLLRAITLFCVSTQLLACADQVVAWPLDAQVSDAQVSDAQVSDITAPTVTWTVPVDGANGVALDSMLSAGFSEPMNPLTLSATSFTLLDGVTPIPGTVNYVGVTATFGPSVRLQADTSYTATIHNTVEDVAGNRLLADYTWTFTTGFAPDTRAPVVTFTIAADGATDAAIDASVLAIFSEAMDPASIDSASFTLMQAATSISGVVTLMGATAMLDPTMSLALDTEYTATITTTAADLAGNRLAADYVWTFRTAPAVDPGAPTVIVTAPADLAIDVTLDTTISATFSDAMDPFTTTSANFGVTDPGGAPVSGMVAYDVPSRTVTLTPSSPLLADTTYTATVTTGATDLSGVPLVADYVWTFTTGAPDTRAPVVTFTIPADGATDAAIDANVLAIFSEAMDPASIDSASFTLMQAATSISGVVTLMGATAMLDPTMSLALDTEYTATITTAAADLAGNSLAADYVWTFRTAPAVDPGAPTVIFTAPADLAIDVPFDTTISATFSEAMDPFTTTSANFGVTDPGGAPVSGMVAYDVPSRAVTLTPSGLLLADTTYTATVTTGATDLSGVALVADYVWTFTTGAPSTGILPVNLGSLSTFVAVSGAGLTNSNSSGFTTLAGDVGLCPTATCLGDGSPCTLTNPIITGTLYANDPAGVCAQAKIDLTAAYVDAMSRPPGTTVNDLSGMVLAPGVYTSGSTMSVAVGGTVTLDGGGDANAVWIFQVGSSLTVNNDAQVLLINGAQAKNVFWAAFASSTLGSNVSFQGSVLAGASNSVGTDSVVVGRLLCTTGQITLLSNTITLPR